MIKLIDYKKKWNVRNTWLSQSHIIRQQPDTLEPI